MDASQSALDSLRTVEFRETLRGYHRDDVDEYLEKAAVEAEGLQEQLRQSGERLRQAAERISQLEAELEAKPEAPPAPVVERAEPSVPDDTLQRTLLLAQKFVDETKADAEAEAARILTDAESKARLLTDQAQSEASKIAAESEQRLRDEIARLESTRSQLSREVETMSRHLESEKQRLRASLGDILKWVDDNVHPASGLGDAPSPGFTSSPSPSAPAAEASRDGERADRSDGPGDGPNGEVTQLRPNGVNSTSGQGASLPL